MALQLLKSSPQNLEGYRPLLHYYSIMLSVLTYLLLFVGGMVTSTNSGLSVPDWPTTFGQNMFTFPPSMMKGGIFYEHGHRLFASMVGMFTVGTCLAYWILEKRRWLQWTGTIALVFVIVQGILGGMTVRYKLPMPVSSAHACLAEIFFLTTILMAFATSKIWFSASSKKGRFRGFELVLAASFCGLVFFQILVGAIMRHSFAGLAIPTFPLAYGQILPPFWNFGIVMNFLHTRVGATLLVILAFILIPRVLRSPNQAPATKGFGWILAAALLVQCLLGMFTIWSHKAPVPTTVHLSVGAFVFATSFLLVLSIFRLQKCLPLELGKNNQDQFSASSHAHGPVTKS